MPAATRVPPATAADREAFDHAEKVYTVASEGVYAMAYDPLTETLFVTYPNGRTYAYPGVPAHAWASFLAADSKGTFCNKSIKPHFSCRGPL